MDSGSPAALSRLLLQRSDRHPIACVNGEDLAEFAATVVRQFELLRILIERAKPTDLDTVVFQPVGDLVAAVSLDGEDETIFVGDSTVQQYDIDFIALCRQLRAANRFEGAPVEKISSKVVWLGALGSGSRRQEFYVARNLRAQNALEVALGIKARSSGALTILTPTERNLSHDVLKRLSADQITIATIADTLRNDSRALLTLSLPQSRTASARSATSRLNIDVEGHRAIFDEREVTLARREFNVLVLLANELTDQNGIVSRERISETIREVTGNKDVNEEQVDIVISRLRGALGKAAGIARKTAAPLIENKRGIGYRLTIPRDVVSIV
jgi:DNA-binding response OmpR family regulator